VQNLTDEKAHLSETLPPPSAAVQEFYIHSPQQCEVKTLAWRCTLCTAVEG